MTRGLTIGVDQKRAHRVVAERRVEHEIELRAGDRIGQRGETIEIVQRLGDFRRAAMAVAHLPLKPARIGGASPKRARDLLPKVRILVAPGMVEFEMIERRIGSRFRRSRGEPTLMLGEGVGVERVLARQVLHVNKSLGAGDPRSKLGRRFARFALAIIGVAGRGKISLRQLGPIRPLAPGDARAEPHAVSAGRRAEYSRGLSP